jgi:hypothetical protein
MTAKNAGERELHHAHLTPLEKFVSPIPPLEVGDIVLVRYKKSFFRWLIRKVTNSYWDHSALVVFAKNPAKGYASNIIAEAIQRRALEVAKRGIEIHKLEKYLLDPLRYDVGIKRFPGLDEETRNRVRAFMLMNVDAPSYRLPIADFFFALLSRSIRRNLLRRQRFSCSGLVQKAYYDAADWGQKHRFAFRELSGDSPIEIQELVTPGDIATSDLCQWIWNAH